MVMASTASARSSYREFLVIAAPAILAVAFAFWFAYQFVEPAPPSQVTITTGSKTGAYYNFAKRYAALLAKSDITLVVESSEGSLSNLSRLRDKNSDATLALLQGGITNHKEDPELVSLGRVFLEPVWVFYNGANKLERLAQLKGKRIAIGSEGSGTRVLALALLKANDLNENNTTLLPLSGTAAAEALKAGDVDAVFLVLSPQAKLVGQLLRDPDIHLMSFKQAEAYTRLFQYLSRVTLPAGVIDLDQQVPKEDVTLVAAQAALVARKDVHPAIVGLMVQAAREVHRPGGIFARFEEFPKAYDPEFPMQHDAERLYKRGPPFLQRFLPFWLANFIERTLIMLIPIATIMLPLFKIVPWLYEWRIRRRILYWYGELKRLEKSISERAGTGQADYLAEVQRIEQAVGEIPVPLHFSDKLYELRAAVDLVHKRIAAMV
jgi:TRAP transporter TAXI family solute receptor